MKANTGKIADVSVYAAEEIDAKAFQPPPSTLVHI
jgi:hypothetical protein